MTAFTDALAAIYADPNVGGSTATLTFGSPPESHDLVAIDLTAGVMRQLGGVDVATIRPAAAVTAASLADLGVSADDLDDAAIALNGAEWVVKAVEPRPNPDGEDAGEYLLFLEAAA